MKGRQEYASLYIRNAIDSLLHAHAQANMYRSDRNIDHIETIEPNLKAAAASIQSAIHDVQDIIKKANSKGETK